MAHILDPGRLALIDEQDALKERVATLEAAVAMLTRTLLQRGDITINDARAAHGLPDLAEP